MAEAISPPISSSPLAETVPTWAIALLSSQGMDICFSSSTAASTALSMPRLISMGFMPAATDFSPSWKIHWASTVAVVVPSPAISEVLAATSLTIWAPMFSNGSSSSTSLATEIPSLVIAGPPYGFCITTLRPRGPSVALTACARILAPRAMCWRASSPNLSSLAGICVHLHL